MYWQNLREEPLVFINGQPFVVREADQPFSNLEYTGESLKSTCIAVTQAGKFLCLLSPQGLASLCQPSKSLQDTAPASHCSQATVAQLSTPCAVPVAHLHVLSPHLLTQASTAREWRTWRYA